MRRAAPAFFALLAALPAHAGGYFGERQVAILRRNADVDPAVQAWMQLHREAARREAQASPQAQAWIRYDPANGVMRGTAEATRDGRLVLAFGVDWRLFGNRNSARRAEEFLLAWVRAFRLEPHPRGNPTEWNPNLHSQEMRYITGDFLRGFELVRDALARPVADEIDSFYRSAFLGSDAYMDSPAAHGLNSYANHYTTHLENLAQIAFVLGDPDLVGRVETLYRELLDWHYLPAGETPRRFWGRSPRAAEILGLFQRNCPAGKLDRTWPRTTAMDAVYRDDVGYSAIAVLDLFHSAWLAENNGRPWFSAHGASGQTLADGFAWLEPLVAQPLVPEYRETCVPSVDRKKGGKSWMQQPDDTVRTLACGALAIPGRFDAALEAGVERVFKLCPIPYLTAEGLKRPVAGMSASGGRPARRRKP